MMLDDALRVQETRGSQIQRQAEQQQAWLIGQQEEASSLGVDTSKFFTTKIDPQTQQPVVTGVDQLGLSKAIGEAKRQDIKNKETAIKESDVAEETRKEAKDVLKGIEDIDKQIREQNFMASRERSETNRDAYLARAEYLRGERDVLTTRFQNLIPQKQAEQPQQAEPQPQTQNSNFQNTLEKFEEVNKRVGANFVERMKKLGVDSVDEIVVNNVLNITGLKDKNELTSALRDQSALDWANANPNDPRSQRIKQRLGVQ